MQVNPFPFKRRARIEMVPLIDMFFLLLVFFIFGVFSMTVQQGMAVELPSAATGTPVKEEGPTISLTADGSLFLHQDPITLEALAAALREEAQRPSLPVVVINADHQVPHGRVMTVLDTVRQAGLQRVSFHTTPEQP